MKKNLKMLLEQYKSLSAPVKASMWFLVCNVLQAGLGVISTPIFTRMMSTEEYGMFNTFNSWRSILMIFTSLNLSYGVFNNAMVKYEDSKTRDEYVSCMQGLYCLITLAFICFYAIAWKWCNDILGMSTEIVILLLLDLFCYPALLFWSGRQRYEFKYKWLVIITLIMSVLNIGLGIVFVKYAVHKDFAKIFSGVLVDVVFCGGFLIYQFFKGKKLCIPKFWTYALGFNIPLVPHYLSEIILNQSDRIMISKIVSNSATANYSIAYSIVTMLQLVMSAINASFLPWAYGCIKRKKYSDMKKMVNILMIMIGSVIVVLMLFAPELIMIFAGKKYAEAVYVIPPIAMSIFFMFFYDMFSTVEFYYGKNIGVMIASIISAALNVALNAILIPRFGYYAAGYTTLVCYFLYALGHYFFYRSVCKKNMEGQRTYDEKSLFLGGGIMMAITLVINLIYPYMWIRYGLVLIIGILFFWKRNFLVEKFRVMKAEKDDRGSN